MRISVCITILNEERTIGNLLKDLNLQTRKPDEIIVVDGGSTDGTLSEISKFPTSLKLRGASKNQKYNGKVKIIKSSGLNIAKGRNEAIKNASNEIIVLTDAGCRLKKDWLEKLTNPFLDKKVDVVAGFYHMTGVTPVSRAIAPFLGVVPERYDPNTFLPSARSMAFRKKVWESVKGFSEKFDRAGEDTLFVSEILKKRFKIVRVKEAVVSWEVPKNAKEIFDKFYYYAKGDAQSGIWMHPTKGYMSHNIHIVSIFLRYIVFLLLFPGMFYTELPYFVPLFIYFLYFFWPIWKMRGIIKSWRVRLYLPFVQILSDLAVMGGFLSGCLVI